MVGSGERWYCGLIDSQVAEDRIVGLVSGISRLFPRSDRRLDSDQAFPMPIGNLVQVLRVEMSED